MKPNCYTCKHRRQLEDDAHSACDHPRIGKDQRIITPVHIMLGNDSPAMKRLNITANKHGIAKGWFMWPINFDPTWLESCDGHEQEENMNTKEQVNNSEVAKYGNASQSALQSVS